MKDNLELERTDIVVLPDMEVEDDPHPKAVAYLETWFDVDKKFGTHTADTDFEWVNLYATYDSVSKTLSLQYQVDRENEGSEFFDYTPTENESKMILEMMEECCQSYHNCSLDEFCDIDNEITLGGLT